MRLRDWISVTEMSGETRVCNDRLIPSLDPYEFLLFGIVLESFLLRERTCNGLEAARKEGRIGGRRSKLKEYQKQEIFQLVTSGQKTAADAARLFNVHPATISRLLRQENSKA